MTAAKLRQLLDRPEMLIVPGAYDGMTARLVERAGFDAVYMTGGGTAMTYGLPDYGLIGMKEMVDNAATITSAIDVPLISDADTGYGNELNVTRTIRQFEARGVAGVHIEDQKLPKRCGHMAGKEILPADEYVSKIRAAVAARRDPDFVIIARTDSRSVAGFDEAVDRVNAALAAGADIGFIEALETAEEIAQVPQRVNGPCLFNDVPGGKTPRLNMRDVEEMGFRIAILPGLLLGAVIEAVETALTVVRETGEPGLVAPSISVREMFARYHVDEWDSLRARFAEAV
jgi:2-methylisocitrate lyase-like PEP mutase family enzyme